MSKSMKKYGMWVSFKIHCWVEDEAESAEAFADQVRDMEYGDILDESGRCGGNYAEIYTGDLDQPEYSRVEEVEE